MFLSEYQTVPSASMAFPLYAHYFFQLRLCLVPLQSRQRELKVDETGKEETLSSPSPDFFPKVFMKALSL